MKPENHPTNARLSQFALGDLTDLEYEQVELHLQHCSDCWDRMVAGDDDNDALISLLRQSQSQASCLNDTIAANEPTTTTNRGTPLALSDRYELLEKIAAGGMGDVWIAYDGLLNREVAVKVLRDSKGHRSELEHSLLYDRFVRESQIVSSLQHPGIPPVYDLGKLAGGKPFLAMKLVRGKTLAQRMADDDVPSMDGLLEVFTQICQTVAFAHSRGVVHRDLKPDNIMVGEFGETQVMDWGISEVTRPSGTEAPSTNAEAPCGPAAIVGTPAYMSPEQAAGERCGPGADVFSLGSLLCEMLTGEPAYRGNNTTELLEKAAAGEVGDAISRLHSSSADPVIVALAEKCLAKSQNDRPDNAKEVADRVTTYLRSVQARLRAAELERAKNEARAAELRRRRRTQQWLAACGICLLAVSYFAWRAQDERKQDAVTQAEAAVDEARNLAAKAGAATQGALGKLETAQAAAARAERMSRRTSDPALKLKAQVLHADLVRQSALAGRIKQLEQELRRIMIFDEGQTVEQRYRNRQQVLRKAVAEDRRSSLVFLRFPSSARPPLAANSSEGRPLPRLNRPAQPRDNGRVRPPSREAFVSGEANVFRYARQREREYRRSFAKFGLGPDQPVAEVVDTFDRFEPLDRKMLTSGLRMWFLLAADTQNGSTTWLSDLLDRLNRRFGESDRSEKCTRLCRQARNAMMIRDVDAIATACEKANAEMEHLPPELLWGLGCFHMRCSSEDGREWFLRHAQRHFLDSFLLNRELARLQTDARRSHEAVPYINGALAVYTDYELSIRLARHLVTAGRIEEYKIVRDRCFNLYPDDPLMFADWGDFMAMRRRPEVFVTYERAIEAGFPEPQILLARMGQLMERSGWIEDAEIMYEKALQIADLPEDHVQELEAALARLAEDSET